MQAMRGNKRLGDKAVWFVGVYLKGNGSIHGIGMT